MAREHNGYAINMLVERGDPVELTRRADSGDRDAACALSQLLVDRGEIDQLRMRAANGDHYAKFAWLSWLVEGGNTDELARLADNGDYAAKVQLCSLLVERGDLDALAARADAGDSLAHRRLLTHLVERGDTDTLAARVEAGDDKAADALSACECLHSGDTEGLTRLADGGGTQALIALAQHLLAEGNVAELRARTARGDMFARAALPLATARLRFAEASPRA
ncbi:hypothetical protein [Pseudonocardia acaciae]|uniref:hypothetical protein n=1 Tax=Pseudonocardia acaciae TaxID=551276 RepID=UPI000A6C9F0F